jgi:hypothetical protein
MSSDSKQSDKAASKHDAPEPSYLTAKRGLM